MAYFLITSESGTKGYGNILNVNDLYTSFATAKAAAIRKKHPHIYEVKPANSGKLNAVDGHTISYENAKVEVITRLSSSSDGKSYKKIPGVTTYNDWFNLGERFVGRDHDSSLGKDDILKWQVPTKEDKFNSAMTELEKFDAKILEQVEALRDYNLPTDERTRVAREINRFKNAQDLLRKQYVDDLPTYEFQVKNIALEMLKINIGKETK